MAGKKSDGKRKSPLRRDSIPIEDFQKTAAVVADTVSDVVANVEIEDLTQMLVGAALLSTPIALTQDVWDLGYTMKTFNAVVMVIVSLAFIAVFIYYSYYKRRKFAKCVRQFVIRVSSTYILSFTVGALLLAMIGVAPWGTDFMVAVKQAVIVAFPASMSAAIVDVVSR